MKREELEALRAKVSCEAILEGNGWKIDISESTKRAVKYRREHDIVIVTHDGRGWFDPLSDKKGDVFGLAMRLTRVTFPAAVEAVASFSGFRLSRPEWRSTRAKAAVVAVEQRWHARHPPRPGSASWCYLNVVRAIPTKVIRLAILQDLLREGPFGSIWAAHTDSDDHLLGWEERGPHWRGFATGGSKLLFRLGVGVLARVCVTEAAIDAMSLSAIEGMRDGTLYLSTGGGWSPSTDDALTVLAERSGLQLIAATDANDQGEAYANRLREVAARAGCDWRRLRPAAEDWNAVLRNREQRKGKENAQ